MKKVKWKSRVSQSQATANTWHQKDATCLAYELIKMEISSIIAYRKESTQPNKLYR